MPYLSIVMCGSNAGHGGNFLERMQTSVDRLFLCGRDAKLDAEFILVEWGPPPDRASLLDAIDWSRVSMPARIIRVPKPFVDALPNPHGERFFEYMAKNVGIQRARGEFILCTNPDTIYSPELVARLARHDLDRNCFYRVDRQDVMGREVTAVHRANGSYGKRLDRYENGQPVFTPYGPPHHLAAIEGQDYPGLGVRPLLHFNAAGDFTMMAKDAWQRIRGYPEVPYLSNVDSYGVWLAALAGLQQVVLPGPLYHAEHTRTPRYGPPWDDNHPHAPKNTDDTWGFPDENFETIELAGYADGISPGDLWNLHEGDKTLLLDYPLTRESIVWDVGGYCGGWTAALIAKLGFSPKVYIFEPVKEFYKACTERFAETPEVCVLSFGLAARKGMATIVKNESRSSVCFVEEGAGTEEIPLGDAAEISKEVPRVDLMSLNAEGAEYAILDRLLDAGLIPRFKYIQVQFHRLVPDAVARRAAIRKRLAETHEEIYNYEFAWEAWRRR